jgi:hypothetical protein
VAEGKDRAVGQPGNWKGMAGNGVVDTIEVYRDDLPFVAFLCCPASMDQIEWLMFFLDWPGQVQRGILLRGFKFA